MSTHLSQEEGWQRSSHSGGDGNCVELRLDRPEIAVRDSKYPDGPTLSFMADAMRDLFADIKANRYDL